MMISCPEEIASWMGYIDEDLLVQHATALGEYVYERYLRGLITDR